MSIDKMKGWTESFAADVETVKKLVTAEKSSRDARHLAAAALQYLVTKMDLIPDWEEAAGILDDAMVLRVAVALASEKGLDGLDGATTAAAGKLANDAEIVASFLGAELYPKFKKYTAELIGKEVRGRRAAQVVDDAKVREQLWTEIAADLKAVPAAGISDPAALERTIKNYLSSKL